MTAGRVGAQAAHAASQAAYMFNRHYDAGLSQYNEWEDQAVEVPDKHFEVDAYKGFGTVILLEVRSKAELMATRRDIDRVGKCFTGMVVDPTYPVRDGHETHYVEIPTCAWALVDDKDITTKEVFKNLKLYDGFH